MKIAFDFDDTLVFYDENEDPPLQINTTLLRFLIKVLKIKAEHSDKNVYVVTARCPSLSKQYFGKKDMCKQRKHSEKAKTLIHRVFDYKIPTVESFLEIAVPEELRKNIIVVYTDGHMKGPELAALGIDILIDNDEIQRHSAEDFDVEAVDPTDLSNLKKYLKDVGFFGRG
jgi:hypothetical protein